MSSLAATGRNGLLMTSYKTQSMLPGPLMYPIQSTARLQINKFTALSQFWVKGTVVCLLCFWSALYGSALNWGFYNADVIDLVDAYDVSITLGNDQLLKQPEVRIAAQDVLESMQFYFVIILCPCLIVSPVRPNWEELPQSKAKTPSMAFGSSDLRWFRVTRNPGEIWAINVCLL